MENLTIQKITGGIIFTAKIIPSSSKTACAGLLDGMVKIKISAAPEKGKANKCLIEFLAKKLDVKKKSVTITSGQTNPVKIIEIRGISDEYLLEKLQLC